jgi:hypothetical protein
MNFFSISSSPATSRKPLMDQRSGCCFVFFLCHDQTPAGWNQSARRTAHCTGEKFHEAPCGEHRFSEPQHKIRSAPMKIVPCGVESPRNGVTLKSDEQVANGAFFRSGGELRPLSPGISARGARLLRAECGLQPSHIVADIASGTGMFTRLLLENGNSVFAVEPNTEMREMGMLHQTSRVMTDWCRLPERPRRQRCVPLRSTSSPPPRPRTGSTCLARAPNSPHSEAGRDGAC